MKYSIFRQIFGYSLKEYNLLEKEKETLTEKVSSLESNLDEKSSKFEKYQEHATKTLNLYEEDEKRAEEELKKIKEKLGGIEEILGRDEFYEFMKKTKQINEINYKLKNETDANKIIKILEHYPIISLRNGRGDHKNIYIQKKYIGALPRGKKSSNRYCALRDLRCNIKKALAKSLFH